MCATFLDLTDDIIRDIGSLLHEDKQPFHPSFKPHWNQAGSGIHPIMQKSYINFSSTCTRIRSLCLFARINVKITKDIDIFRWVYGAPTWVANSVRRLDIDIPPPTINRVKTKAGSSNAEWHFLTLMSLLRRLTNLEELILGRLPICQGESHQFLNLINITNKHLLSNLKSLSFESPCSICSELLPKVIIPIFNHKKLDHLKLPGLQEYLKEKPSFLTQLALKNPSTSLNLKTLSIKSEFFDDDIHPASTLVCVSHHFPKLENLYMSAHDDDGIFQSSYTVFGYTKSLINPQWNFILKSDGTYDEFPELDPVDTWEQDHSMDIFLNSLTTFKNLKFLECNMAIKLGDQPYINPTNQFQKKMLAQANVNSASAPAIHSSDSHLKSAMIAVAELLIAHIPTLESGTIWEHFQNQLDTSQEYSHRWTWQSRSSSTGTSEIIFPPCPEWLDRKYMINLDGQKDWTYQLPWDINDEKNGAIENRQ
ncbi:uncharacterized protein L201_006703 [Kwoniella dendrophila CBS 6074]|uniref:F-box domain-containing protein n=1 Tax=Kwoniella dendrophila CBS 6074 TaxID=1295534 RepID=A0AAX4K1Y8_9TREE